MPVIPLTDSVGTAGVAANKPPDVLAVRRRLIELGFNWLDPTAPAMDADTEHAVRLFQAIKNGHESVAHPLNDGVVEVSKNTHLWLQAANAPRWQLIREWGPEQGFVKRFDADDQNFGTNWLADTLMAAGAAYVINYRAAHPQAARITVNDISRPRGQNPDDHQGHETGLVCDVLLPRLDGTSGGNLTFADADFDRPAARAMAGAFKALPWVLVVRFNDPALADLCKPDPRGDRTHDNHFHVQIKPPALIGG